MLNAVLGPKDSFDSRALVHGAAGEDFTAAEETLCFLVPQAGGAGADLPQPRLRRLLLLRDLARSSSAFADAHRAEGMESVLRARVREAKLGPAVFIDAGATMEQAGHRMAESGGNVLFVRRTASGRIGVVTGMNLSKAAVLRRLPLETPVRDICHFDVVVGGRGGLHVRGAAADDPARQAPGRGAAQRRVRRLPGGHRHPRPGRRQHPAHPRPHRPRPQRGRAGRPGARHPGPGGAAAPPGREGGADRRDHLRPQPAAVRQAVRACWRRPRSGRRAASC